MIDYIIVGSGLAGVVMAERIATQLNKKVLMMKNATMSVEIVTILKMKIIF